MQKGQYIRLLLSTTANPSKVIAAAKEMSLHLSAQTENSSTKDTTGDWLEYEVTQQSYDISFNALVLSPDDSLGGNTANTLNDMLNGVSDNVLYWKICVMSGANNRTVATEICSGTAKLTQLQISAQNKQNATYSGTLSSNDAISVPEGE